MFQATRDSIKKFIVWLMMLNDTPHSIAMGVAVGFFIALTPTVGIQMLLVTLTSMFIRCNRTAGCAMTWTTNFLTMAPVFFFNYLVGAWLLRIHPLKWEAFLHKIRDAFEYPHWYQNLAAMLLAFGRLTLDMAGPLWLGSLLVALVGSLPLYFIVRKGVVTYRRLHQHRLEAALARESAPRENQDGKSSEREAVQDG